MGCEITVSFAGPMITLQDAGRPGFARFGVPASGPMDPLALATVNAALGNQPDTCAIEISLGGLQLDCTSGAVTFAVAGGGFQVILDGKPRAPWTVATLSAGQRLQIRPGAWGSWAMLGFAGGIGGTAWLGSLATHSQSGLGGGALISGTKLSLPLAEVRTAREGDLPMPDWAKPTGQARVVIGPQDRFFAPETQAQFLGEGFTLSGAYDRMGVRLNGPSLPITAALDMPSEPILRGAVQVAGDTVATVMLADHGTTGGYPKIATVISPDLAALTQLRSGDALRFTATSPEQAVQAARQHHAITTAYLAEIAAPRLTLTDRLLRANLISGVVSHDDP